MPERRPQPEAGMRARHDGHCARCDAPIVRNETRIVFQRGRAICVGCANGAGDE